MRKKEGIYNFLDLAREVLEASDRPLSINAIWERAESMNIHEKVDSKGRTPIRTLAARIYIDIRDNEKSIFVQSSKRPALFYLKSKRVNVDEIVEIPETTVVKDFQERDLHILLSSFAQADANFRCFTKTIYHEKSSNRRKGHNQWLHPDLVGCHFPFSNYTDETLMLQKIFNNNSFKLFSFEIKINLSYNNLRENYFQAVSNSSWANQGYLVALNIIEEESFVEELRRLNNAFGIGIIKLVPENISQSIVMFPSNEKGIVDWDTIDRLMTENPDFKEFVTDIMDDVEIGKVKSKYDKVFKDDKSAAIYAREKKII